MAFIMHEVYKFKKKVIIQKKKSTLSSENKTLDIHEFIRIESYKNTKKLI